MFNVALALHHPNPRKMLEEMDKDTFMYWVAFLNRKSKEHTKQDYQQALLTKIVAEMLSKGSGKPLDRYLIKFQTEEEQIEELLEENRRYVDSLPTKGAIVEYTYYNGE